MVNPVAMSVLNALLTERVAEREKSKAVDFEQALEQQTTNELSSIEQVAQTEEETQVHEREPEQNPLFYLPLPRKRKKGRRSLRAIVPFRAGKAHIDVTG